MCGRESGLDKLEFEASGLRSAGKYKEAKEKCLQVFDELRNTDMVYTAMMLFMAGDCAHFSKEYFEAAGYFQTGADLSCGKRDSLE